MRTCPVHNIELYKNGYCDECKARRVPQIFGKTITKEVFAKRFKILDKLSENPAVRIFISKIIQNEDWRSTIKKFPQNDLDGSIVDALYDYADSSKKIKQVKEAYSKLFKERPSYISRIAKLSEDEDDEEGGDVRVFRWLEHFVSRDVLYRNLNSGILLAKDLRKEFTWHAELYLFAKHLMGQKQWYEAWLLLTKLFMMQRNPQDLQKWLSNYEDDSGHTLSHNEKTPDIETLARFAFDEYIKETDSDQIYDASSCYLMRLIQAESDHKEVKRQMKRMEDLIITWSKIFINPQESYESWRKMDKELRINEVKLADISRSLNIMRAFSMLRDIELQTRKLLAKYLPKFYRREGWKRAIPDEVKNALRPGSHLTIESVIQDMEFWMYIRIIEFNADKFKNTEILGILDQARRLRNQFYHLKVSDFEKFADTVKSCHDKFTRSCSALG